MHWPALCRTSMWSCRATKSPPAPRGTRGIVVAEEHLAPGGLGSCVAAAPAEMQPARMRFVNIGDRLAESGAPGALLEEYGLTYPHIVRAAKELL